MNTSLLDLYSACTTANVNCCIGFHQSLKKNIVLNVRHSLQTANSWTCRYQTGKLFINRFLQSCLNEASIFRVALRVTVNRSVHSHNETDNLFGSKNLPCSVVFHILVANSTLHKLQQRNQQYVLIYNRTFMITEWTSACACRDGSRW